MGCKKNNDRVWGEQVDTTAAGWLDGREGRGKPYDGRMDEHVNMIMPWQCGGG